MSKKKTTVVLSAQELRTKQRGNYIVREVADHEIDYSDIPELTSEQLKKFRPLSKKKQKQFK